ncbi:MULTISPECIES: hypothetical protein [Actinomadura]|uniref:DUF1707 domain-containing protein n=1 Tax=Actinomadura yumaensis TaxID=111807 RepID=A0ABW2CVG3_9ACTN|nr:hypothetical protein [Actinomadura sp. J1-007]MWK39100.1 hypothetical protein [Actinomadura sp. J1-007]
MTTPRLPREDLTAALAARRELGPEYDDAFIETVVDRIKETLDARGASPAPAPAPRRAPVTTGTGGQDHSLALAVLSLLAAIPLSAIAVVNADLPGLFLILAMIVLVNATYMFRPRR